MGLAPHKEFWIEFSILSSCLATNSVNVHNGCITSAIIMSYTNGRCYTTIVYIIIPPPLKSGLSQSLLIYIYQKNEWNVRIWSSFYGLPALGN